MDDFLEQKVASMTSDEFDAFVLRTRPPQESTDPKERAAAALRKQLGVNVRGRKPSNEAAADALRRYAANR